MERGVELCQQACQAFIDAGACDRAARLAVWVSHQYLIAGKASLSNGWLARADRALEGNMNCAGAGWVAVERARRAVGAESLADARKALELGHAGADHDLEVFALSVLGQAEIAAGDFDEGLGHLEEAMAAATAGAIRNPHTLAEAYCNMIAATTSAGDWERATEWCVLVDEHASNRAILPLYGACRATHAEVLAAAAAGTMPSTRSTRPGPRTRATTPRSEARRPPRSHSSGSARAGAVERQDRAVARVLVDQHAPLGRTLPSPALVVAAIMLQYASASVCGLRIAPAVAAAIASSRWPRPSSKSPAAISAWPRTESAKTSRSASAHARPSPSASRASTSDSAPSALRARSTATQPAPEQFVFPSSARSARASQPFESDDLPAMRYWCDTQTASRAARSQAPAPMKAW